MSFGWFREKVVDVDRVDGSLLRWSLDVGQPLAPRARFSKDAARIVHRFLARMTSMHDFFVVASRRSMSSRGTSEPRNDRS